MDLTKKHCIPCEAGTPPLPDEKEDELIKGVSGWELLRGDPLTGSVHKIKRQFKFKDFKEAMGFVNKVAEIAENEGHHPNITIIYNRVAITCLTHAIGGLSENDFILAAKIDTILKSPVGT